MREEIVYGITSCQNCGQREMNVRVYEDMQSAQTVYHCVSCGYIYWTPLLAGES